MEDAVLTADVKKEVSVKIEEWLNSLMWLLTSDQTCLISSQVYLHIVTTVLKQVAAAVTRNMWQQIFQALYSLVFHSEVSILLNQIDK